MALTLLSLLLAVVAVHGIAPNFYQPQITAQAMDGSITSTTFALDKPACVFSGDATDTIYLLVSYANASTSIPFGLITTATAATYSYRNLEAQRFYIAMNTAGNTYKCPGSNETGPLSVLRIGNNPACVQSPTTDFCNGPLQPGASYRVIFIVLDITGSRTLTRWSEVITLKSRRDSSTIDTWMGRRSGGMIVITTILSVLLAILLACLIAAFAVGTKDICWRRTLANQTYEDPEINKLKRYTSHQAPEPYRI